MSKVDALRAMREARYAANQSRRPAGAAPSAPAPAASSATTPAASAKKAPVRRPAAAAPEAGPGEAAPEAALCGHTNMTGKACRRPAGHAEKNHRYV